MSNKILLPTLLSILIGCYSNIYSMESANKPQIISKYNNNEESKNEALEKYNNYVNETIKPFIHKEFENGKVSIDTKFILLRLLHHITSIDLISYKTYAKEINSDLNYLLNNNQIASNNKKQLLQFAQYLVNLLNEYAAIKVFSQFWNIKSIPSSIKNDEELKIEVTKLLQCAKECSEPLITYTQNFTKAVLGGKDARAVARYAISDIGYTLQSIQSNSKDAFKTQFLKVCRGYVDIKFAGNLQALVDIWSTKLNSSNSSTIAKLEALKKSIAETIPNTVGTKQNLLNIMQNIVDCFSSGQKDKLEYYYFSLLNTIDDLDNTQHKNFVENVLADVETIITQQSV